MAQEFFLKPTHSSAPDTVSGANLNTEQLKAVAAKDGAYLLIAGAGSGKTKTLVHRVAKLVSEGVPPESILLLTFTRKSAQEMMRRASYLSDSRCSLISGGTFHGFANMILRQHHDAFGYPANFTILDRSDAEDIVGYIRKNLGLNKADKRFPKKGTLMSLISKSKNTQLDKAVLLEREYPHFLVYANEINAIQTQYEAYKKESLVMDYDDLLITLGELCDRCPGLKADISKQFRYIMVDEYQDTNKQQASLLKALSSVHKNIMVVGDDSQSIYSFRGAHFKNIMAFPQEFDGAEVITLAQNYRSTQPILALCNALIDGAPEKYDKDLFTDRLGGEQPVYIEAYNEHEQSRFIAQKILSLQEEGVSLNKIAVLFRSAFQSNDLEVELQSSQLPYIKYGGFKFVETAHVKDVISFLKVVFNPLDKISWHRFLNLLEGVGAKTADAVVKHVNAVNGCLEALCASAWKGKRFYLDLHGLFEMLKRVENKKPEILIKEILEYYMPFLKQNYDDYHRRERDLKALEEISKRYTDMETFLTELSLDPPEGSRKAGEIDQEEEHVTLSTIHSAKGLEWHTVFIVSLVDGLLPSFRSLKDPDQVEEERRLLYVAITRAKENLFLLKPHLESTSYQYGQYSGMALSSWTRFLSQDDLLTRLATPCYLKESDDRLSSDSTGSTGTRPSSPIYRF